MEKTIFEEFEVAGKQIFKRVKELIRQGNVRRIIIKDKRGEKLIETPFIWGAGGIGTMIILTPFLSALSFVALMVSEATITVERAAGYDEKEVEADEIEIIDDEDTAKT